MRGPFAEVHLKDWSDWRWQLRNRLRTVEDLERVVPLTDDEREACALTADRFRLGVTPYYASLIDPSDPGCPIRRQAIPSRAEASVHPDELSDPLAEERDMPVPGLTRRYPDRVLLYTTHTCAVYCRHCTRRRKVSDPASAPPRDRLSAAIDWIAEHSEVRDVILSGGDPLSLPDAVLARLLARLIAIPHVDLVRIGTRNPTSLPQRVTPELCEVLRRASPIYIMTHFNHARECTVEARRAAAMLAEAGCVLSNQAVLLRGVNDTPEAQLALSRALLAMRIRPYRLYQCDLSEGTSHFRTPLQRGVEILDAMRGRISGLAMPELIVDLPGGRGKVPLHPGNVVAKHPDHWVFRSYLGEEVRVPEV